MFPSGLIGVPKERLGLKSCVLCDTTYKEVVSHESTCWLSLEKAITRILELYTSQSNDKS